MIPCLLSDDAPASNNLAPTMPRHHWPMPTQRPPREARAPSRQGDHRHPAVRVNGSCLPGDRLMSPAWAIEWFERLLVS
jgi:hypothetical protein